MSHENPGRTLQAKRFLFAQELNFSSLKNGKTPETVYYARYLPLSTQQLQMTSLTPRANSHRAVPSSDMPTTIEKPLYRNKIRYS